ncbi:2-oxoacid:acceptor oxidoreductase family protein [Streptomyces oceani]|uniref:2-oxoacid:acceptor oxidoreductase family protein n=1 Tax=Streptomyces oceani TaxID=1075402 RepID=UPI0009A13022|nr:2-oxoacid:acceptor oxidoreductase family protein [Streptomyces oceani]
MSISVHSSIVGDGTRAPVLKVQQLDRVIIRFAGDSGDGMQLTGDRFTSETASFGNDLSTLPNFPAEIRAPAGTLPGVSSFQLHFADHDILTPGDAPNVLVAMNPAALKANLHDLPHGAEVIVNTDEFTKRAMAKVGYDASPLEDGSLTAYNVHGVPLTTLTVEALKDFEVSRKDAGRSKNMFALGLLSWMYNRPTDSTEEFLRTKFARKPEVARANIAAYRAGWNFGETTEDFAVSYEVAPATSAFPPGTYRNISGNLALSYGLVAVSQQADLPLFLGSYPITPASDVLHELSKHKNFGVRTFQAEDEISAIGAALGASFGGALGVTTTSGPGVALKSETIGLAVSLELPLLVIDIQRGGPSTGMPTKTEQADLLQAMYGRNGEAPVPIVAAATPVDCFTAALDAARIALTYRTPVFLLSDGYLANGSEPWRVPEVDSLPDLRVQFAQSPNHELHDGTEVFWPYKRDPQTLASRPRFRTALPYGSAPGRNLHRTDGPYEQPPRGCSRLGSWVRHIRGVTSGTSHRGLGQRSGPEHMEDSVRVVVAEDSVLLREGLTRLLTDRGHEVVGSVGDGEALIKAVAELSETGTAPDVVVADVRMPPSHTDEGVRAAVRLRATYPTLGVLVLSQYVEEEYATELLAGSTHSIGYLLKDRVAEVREFVDAVVRVAEGGTALDPEVVSQLLGRSRKQDVLAGLTPREREVLQLMAEGRTNSAIAATLVVSHGAVEKHVSNIFLKLGLSQSDGDHRRVLAVLTYLNS